MEIPGHMLSASVVLNRKEEKQSHHWNRGYVKNPKNWVPSASCPCHGNILRPRAPTCPVTAFIGTCERNCTHLERNTRSPSHIRADTRFSSGFQRRKSSSA